MAAQHPTSRRPQSPPRTSSSPSDKLPDGIQKEQHRQGLRHGHGPDDDDDDDDDRPSLPHGARPLSHWDYAAFQPIFAHYLARQKRLRLADLSANETRRRWRSFVGCWNRRGLADGWYQPQMALRAVWAQAGQRQQRQRRQQEEEREKAEEAEEAEEAEKAEEASSPTAGDESLVHPDDSDSDSDHDSIYGSRALPRDRLCRDERAEHDVRLQELLPRITSSSSSSTVGASTAAGTHYRRMLVVLRQRQRQQGGGPEDIVREKA